MPAPPHDAERRFRAGFNCSQSVLSAFADRFDLPADLALRIAAPFGSGFARTGETCGAVSGALMVIGLAFGTTAPGDADGKERLYQRAQEVIARFEDLHGAIRCRDLLHCDVSTAQGRASAQERKLFEELCPQLVSDAARIVSEVLEQAPRRS